jgi:hypothetical protein
MTKTCQHKQVSNATWQCTECGAKMVARRDEPQRLLAGSSPNAPSFLEGFEVIYDCERCASDETPDCGQTHRGEYLNAAGKSRRD